MRTRSRWNHAPDVAPRGDEFVASSRAFPGVYGETRGEAVESFWRMVDLIGELAQAPDGPHDRSPCVDEWREGGGDALPWEQGEADEEG